MLAREHVGMAGHGCLSSKLCHIRLWVIDMEGKIQQTKKQ
jgi:hypothetical protein